jgi:hypothetical protein
MTEPLPFSRVSTYRQRAAEARANAAAASDAVLVASLLQTAETWERMADYEEKHKAQEPGALQ